MEWDKVLAEVEDRLFPRLSVGIRERGLYYHLLRRTRLVGVDSVVFAILPLANALSISQTTAREDLRSLHSKGCIQIDERSRRGHVVRVLLPHEIEGLDEIKPASPPVDVESLDFYNDRHYLDALLAREDQRCFYCLRMVGRDTCCLDHVTPQVGGGGNSYRNVVVACHDCNSLKQGSPAEDHLRSLYRRGLLSADELAGRLSALEQVGEGRLVPTI